MQFFLDLEQRSVDSQSSILKSSLHQPIWDTTACWARYYPHARYGQTMSRSPSLWSPFDCDPWTVGSIPIPLSVRLSFALLLRIFFLVLDSLFSLLILSLFSFIVSIYLLSSISKTSWNQKQKRCSSFFILSCSGSVLLSFPQSQTVNYNECGCEQTL